jgi:Flp pilus assembly protein TadD
VIAADFIAFTATAMPLAPTPSAEALFQQSIAHMESGDAAGAEGLLRKALDLAPGFADALTNLGFLLDQRGDLASAEVAYSQALAAGADSCELHLNLGALLAPQKRFAEAEQSYRAALRCDPLSAAAWSNLGVLYIALKREAEAQQCLAKALAIQPDHRKARFNLGYVHLRQGRYEEGWQCMESRDWYAVFEKHFTIPRWQGEPIAGRSIAVGYEAGHGDVIQFARYIPMLKAAGASRITLICHPALKTLMMTLEGIGSVIALDEDVPSDGWDYWTPLMSLPYRFSTRAASIPTYIPYLHTDAHKVQQWSNQLPHGRPRIGLVWKGNPRFDNDADRSLAHLRQLAPLWSVQGAQFVSLQKGAGEDEPDTMGPGFPLTHLGPQMESFVDSAALLVQMDLLICVDTAMAHLAGALGVPCWLLLPDYMTDWRWGSAGNSSLWYPDTMCLFRQGPSGNWTEAIAQVTLALQTFVDNRTA